MPGFKLKSILSRAVLGESWRERDGSDYLYAGIENNNLESHSHEHNESVSDGDNEDDDRNSINSFSTSATASNLPGAGRTVDTYIYQPLGRGIERLGKRLSSRRRTGREDTSALVICYASATADVDDNSSVSSINTFSTTATANDLPGAGRSVDTYIYQPLGRRIERLAMRFTISSLHPACIAQYIGPDVSGFFISFDASMTLHDAVTDVCSYKRNGSTVVAGMKGLVKQTQSDSIDRSAAALAALIRVSLGMHRKEIYANVSRTESIFHLETLVRSHPDKKWFLFLVKLGRETLVAMKSPSNQKSFDPLVGNAVWQLRPSLETALNLRQRLIRVFDLYRLSGHVSLDDTIGEACAICAEAVSTCISTDARGDAYMNILDTVYFTVIFILRSIYDLADLAKNTTSKHIYMTLRTLACWMDAIVYQCIDSAKTHQFKYDMDRLNAAIAFRSVILVDFNTKYMLLPESFKTVRRELLSCSGIPRRNREANKYIHHLESLIEVAMQRTRRLLRSFDALEIEVQGCTSQSNYSTTHLKIIADPYWDFVDDFGDEWWKCWKIRLERARRVRVQANSFTAEFRFARRDRLEDWAEYELRRLSRHKWGQYLRSNMDWDWELGTCMKHLFKVEKQTRLVAGQSPPSSSPTIGMSAERGAFWKISTGKVQESMPKEPEVQIACKTEDGKTQYMSFVPASPHQERYHISSFSNAGLSTRECLGQGSGRMVVQENAGLSAGDFGQEQQAEDAGPLFSDSEQL